ncbi:MAG TPA: ATP-binding protein [Burkholderiaceae bacterium]|nr:ATP-binding protein [Burkholderiaceae bacterium]
MSDGATLSVQAGMAHWPRALAFIEGYCAANDIAREDMLRLVLVAEELFTNAVEHGHAGGTQASIRLALTRWPDRVQMLLEDGAPPFDPLAQAARQADLAEAVFDERPVGGLGLHLVAQLASDMRYAREEGCNRLWITLALAGEAGGVA